MGLLNDLIDLVLPSTCLGCGVAQGAWCAACRPTPAPVLARLVTDPLTFAAGEYGGDLRTALIAYKERGHRRLAPILAGYLGHAVQSVVESVASCAGSDSTRPLLVAVPSTAAAARERGGDHVRRLAVCLEKQGLADVESVLAFTSRVADSAGLSTPQRVVNLSHRMRARSPRGLEASRQIIVIDDIVTTGTTLIEARRALHAAGWQVSGAAVVAATKRRWPEAGSHPKFCRITTADDAHKRR
jgi:predicted amidophosphoribosyltransferase